MADSCESGREICGSIKLGVFVGWLSDCQRLKNVPAPRCYFCKRFT
jgi:hypothetical protein